MKLKHLSTFAFCILIYSISFGQNIPIIDLAGNLDKQSEITCKDFIETITYLPLETTPEGLIDNNPRVFVNKDYIITITSEKCLLFDRKTGSFIREIGRRGRGPGEYGYTLGFFNELNSTYYFIGLNDNFIKYSLDGSYKGSVKIPNYVSDLISPTAGDSYSFFDDSILVCNFGIYYGTEPNSIMLFSESGKIIQTIPNNYVLKNKQNMVFKTKEIQFHHFNNNLFFENTYNDTVFKIDINKITPSFILYRGKHRPPYDSRWWPFEKQQKADFIYQPEYFENSRYISFNFYRNQVRHFALFDKLSKTFKITENKAGIKNNIDNFIDFTFSTINNEGELSCLIQASELIQWIEKNPAKFKILKPNLQKLKNIKMEDNPIVVIAKYKQ